MVRWVLVSVLASCDGGLTFYGKPDAAIPTDPQASTPTSTSTPSTATTPTPGGTTPLVDSGTTSPPTTPSTSTSSGSGGSTATVPWTNGDLASPPPYTAVNPPDLVLVGPCSGTPTSVPDGSGEVVVESHDDNNEVKDLQAPTAGWYDLYDFSLANSGSSETNEIARVRITNAVYTTGDSVFANCGTDWVGPDPDNVTDPGTELLYLGTFWFEPGANTLDLQHFCPSIRAGICTSLEDLTDADSTCEAGDDNDVGLVATGLCLMEPTP